jgi:RNA polymerase sigma-70 factor (ECF subfamily)
MKSIDAVIEEHGPSVSAYIRSLVRDKSMVDDLVQETFIRVWRYQSSFRGDGSFQGWIVSIAHNVVVSAMAKRIDVPTLELDVPPTVDEYSEIDFVSVVAQLPIDQRHAVALCLVMGFSYQEAADISNVPIGTIRSRVSRGRESLREILAASEQIEIRVAQ